MHLSCIWKRLTAGSPDSRSAHYPKLVSTLMAVFISIALFPIYPLQAFARTAADPSGATGYWNFNEGSGTAAHDTSGNGNNAVINGASWTTGKIGGALSFNGSNNSVDTQKALLNTSNSFTALAWVRLNRTNGTFTALSQDGNNVSAFYLQYKTSSASNCSGRFGFTMMSADSADLSQAVCAGSTLNPTTGTWYHLAGVYDATIHQVKLYVNGTLQSVAPLRVGWSAQGETVIGRAKWSGGTVDFWDGQIDEAHIYARALSDSEVQQLAGGGGSAGKFFSNPILTKYSFNTAADPSMMRWNSNYYYTGSTNDNQIWIWKTATLTSLGSAAPVKVWTPPANVAYSKDVWAPELDYINGNWYIYFAADDGTEGNHRIFVLKGNTQDPQGAYTFVGQVAASTNAYAIDPGILQTGNKLYMVWSGQPSGGGKTNIYIALMSDPTHIQGDRVMISTPMQSWETNGAPINEGPVAHVRNGILYITYSASSSLGDDYAVGVLINRSGNVLDPASWSKVGPILQRGNGVFGPGSFQWVPSEDGSEDWFLYHATDMPSFFCGSGFWTCRTIRLQKMSWNSDGTPNLGSPIPSGSPIPVPAGE